MTSQPLRLTPQYVEAIETQVMQVLVLFLDVAYHDGSPRDLAVAAEAWSLAGFNDGEIMVSHAGHEETLDRVLAARRGRPRRLLKHDAQGLLYAARTLVAQGLIEGREASVRTNERWKERGGYNR